MARPIVAGNWKMNGSIATAESIARAVRGAVDGIEGVETVLCPPFPYLPIVRECVNGSSVRVGAQNMHFEAKGAFTGEVAPSMVAELCDYVILGHSERRALFGETDAGVNRKVRAALDLGVRPIVCVGETPAQREGGEAEGVVLDQLTSALEGVADPTALAIAYEPIWAIGTGVAATPETAVEIMGGVIQQALVGLYGLEAGMEVPLLYGGSVNAANTESFMAQGAIHGALVGGASLDADEFAAIVRRTAAAKGGS